MKRLTSCTLLIGLTLAHAAIAHAQSNSPSTTPTPLPTASPSLTREQRLIEAQINNQEAQVEYYKKQSSGESALATGLNSFMGTLIGAGLALLGVWWTGKRQAELENVRWVRARKDEEDKRRQTREDELRRDIRLAAAELSRKIAAGAQAISWLVWKARFDLENLTGRDKSAYDREIKSLLADLVGAEVVVAALDKDVFARMKPLINELYLLDHQVAFAIRHFQDSGEKRTDSIKQLNDLYEPASDFFNKISGTVLNSLGLPDEQRKPDADARDQRNDRAQSNDSVAQVE